MPTQPPQPKPGLGFGAWYTAGQFLQGIFTDRFTTAKEHVLNMASPTTLPDPQSMIDLVKYGLCDPSWVANELLMLGVPIFKDGKITKNHGLGQVWRLIMEMSRTLPPPDVYWRYLVSNNKDVSGGWNNYLSRTGANQEWWKNLTPLLYSRPGESDILDQYVRGVLTTEQMRQLLRENGTNLGLWDKELATRYWSPSPLDAVEMYRRGLVKFSEFADFIRSAGIPEDFWKGEDGLLFPFKRSDHDTRVIGGVAYFNELSHWLPSPSDLVGMMVKDVFTRSVTDEYGLFNDYNPAVDKWFDKLGMVYDIGLKGKVDGQEKSLHWGHLSWGQHWRNLGAGQFFQFMHRIRPDNIDRWKRLGFNVEPFTIDRVRLGLRVDDYPPKMRDYLAAVSFKPLEVRRVQQGVRTGVLSREQVLSAWLDHGYDRETAETATKITLAWAKYAERANIRQIERALPRQVMKETLLGYRQGNVGRDGALEILRQYMSREGVAEGYLDLEDARLHREMMGGLIAAVKKGFLSGADTPESATSTLEDAGIDSARAAYYVRLWGLQRTHRKRAATSAQLIGWVAKGLMTPTDAAARLSNLGWDNADSAVLLADAQGKLAHLQAREDAQVARNKQQLARAMAQIDRELAKLQRDVQARLKASEPISRLIRWLKEGIIDAPQFRQRMQQIGVVPSVIDQYIAEVTGEQAQAAIRAAEKAAAQSLRQSRNPPISTIKKWLRLAIISAEQFASMAEAVKVRPEDIENYIQEVAASKK